MKISEADQDLFKRMTAVYDWVMALELTQRQVPRPRPQHNVVIIRTGNWGSTSSTTSTSTMGSGGFSWRW